MGEEAFELKTTENGNEGMEPIKTIPNVIEEKKPEIESFLKRFGGIFMAMASSSFFTVCILIIKILSQKYSYPPNGIAVLFNLGVIIPCIPAMMLHEWGPCWEKRRRIQADLWPMSDPLKRKTIAILVLQGSLQGISLLLRSQSLHYIPIGDMTVIVFSSPVLVAVLAHFILKERCAVWPILLAVVTFGGVFLIMKPPLLTGQETFDTNRLTGSLFAVGALFSLSLKFVVTRSIKETHFLTMTFFLGTCGLIISFPLFITFESWESIWPKTTFEILLICGLLLGFCAVLCINLALKMETAGTVALVRSLDVIFAFLLQFLFFGEVPDMLTIIGAAMVVFGVLVMGLRKWIYELKPENDLRKRMTWFLV